MILLKRIFLPSDILKVLWSVAFPLYVLILLVLLFYLTTLQPPHFLGIANTECGFLRAFSENITVNRRDIMSYEQETKKLTDAIPDFDKQKPRIEKYLKEQKGFSEDDLRSVRSAQQVINYHDDMKAYQRSLKKPYRVNPNDKRARTTQVAELLTHEGVIPDRTKKKSVIEQVHARRRGNADNHPQYSQQDRLAAINKLIGGK